MFQNLLNGNSIIKYRKIPLIRPGQMTNLMGFYSVICNLLDLDTRIHKVNDKVNNKDIVDVILVSLLLDLNTFHF